MSSEQVLYRNYYRAIVIDFPRTFKARAPNKNPNSDRSIEKHYRTMTQKQILEFCTEIRQLAHPAGCHIFNWTSGPHLHRFMDECRAMGARYSSVAFYFAKLQKSLRGQIQLTTTDIAELEKLFFMGPGFTTRKNIEPCILYRIGSPKRKGKDVPELILDYRREHSRKPDETLRRVEQYCDGPYLEFFSRSSRPGWTHWGDEVGKFDSPQPKPPKKSRPAKPEKVESAPVDPRQIDLLT